MNREKNFWFLWLTFIFLMLAGPLAASGVYFSIVDISNFQMNDNETKLLCIVISEIGLGVIISAFIARHLVNE